MVVNYKFYKDVDSRWYVDIPDYPGEMAELEMVDGADIMLAIMAQDADEVYLSLSDDQTAFVDFGEIDVTSGTSIINGYKSWTQITRLTKVVDTPEIGGAKYIFDKWQGIEYNYPVWLCEVTEYVFGYLPNTIYVV